MSAQCGGPDGLCYGLKGRFLMPNVKEAHRRNLRISRGKHFASWMSGMIRDFCVQTLRAHVVGDFYDENYIEKWHQVVRLNRRTKFFAFTRSWAVAELYEPLLALGREPNFAMWLSYDLSMPVPPRVRGFRRCYLAAHDEDQPPRRRADLIFRDDRSTVLKVIDDGTLVCPFDNGVTQTTCSKCKLCWETKHGPKRRTKDRDRRKSRTD